MARKESKTIGFKAGGELLLRLQEIAKRDGVSAHEWARRAIIRELDSGSQIRKIALNAEAIIQELAELRKDVAVATEAVLVSGGKASLEQAAKFVKINLRGE